MNDLRDLVSGGSSQPVKRMAFAKGHGTGNDFVILPDPNGELDLPAELVAALCDRRRGLGGDGVLRVVRTAACPEVSGRAEEGSRAIPEWFMDYRNADGSLAEMCGNGVRVYARYLVEAGLVTGPSVSILTRAGTVSAEVGKGSVAVDMPVPQVHGESTARLSDVELAGTVVACGNPNLVCRVGEPAALDLSHSPELDESAVPTGANVEFVAAVGPESDLHVRMRVVERGVGETPSCGSGACAVAAVVLRDAGRDAGTVTVDVPGGRLTVTVADGRCELAGPAVIVASGEVRL